MKIRFCLSLLALTLFNCTAQKNSLYVGTYTKGESEGIYKLDFNTKTGVLSNKILAIKTENPSFIAFSPNKKYIYAVGEGETSAITAFKVNNNKTLTYINKESSNGKGPCHVAVNNAGNKAVVSTYGGGTASVYSINTDGSLKKASQTFNHNTDNKKARAHSAQFYKDDLFVSDLGRNALYQYKLNDDNYTLKSESIIKMDGNPGPRHFAISKDGEFIYIINEYGASITSVKKTNDGFKQIDHDSTLRADYTGKNSCADIHLSPDERFLYGSNRGENSIAVFKRDTETGTIEKIQNISVNGDWPRNFTLDPTGKFVLVANQKSENISVYSINKNTGKLMFLHDIKVPSPVCLLF
ncbi:lactonase family protein [Postechiella marina]|uniref:Lactonase family protein n=1 Tax=Postechiella marina TaxID=943941 RepID=A0ABP8C3I6_9FLAO